MLPRVLSLLLLFACVTPGVVSAQAAEPPVELRLEAIRVVGNTRTSTTLIESVLNVPPGRPLSEIAAERGRLRLLSLGFFVDVRLRLEKGSRRGDVVLVVEVEERPTVIVNDVYLGVDEDTGFWGGVDVAERNLFGTGIGTSLAFVAGDDQQAWRLRLFDPAVLGTPIALSAAALLVNGAEPIVSPRAGGRVQADDSAPSGYVRLPYRRAGGIASLGTPLTGFTSVFVDYRFEHLRADVPEVLLAHGPGGDAARYLPPGLADGTGRISSAAVTLVRDSRNDHFLPTGGSFLLFAAELAHRTLGSTYDYARFRVHHDRYWHLGRGHALKVGMAAGLLVGDAPFFEHFFVGDVHDLVPTRALGLNYSIRRPPELLGSTLDEKRYEDVFGRVGIEYALPLTEGRGRFLYRSDFFVSIGLVGLTSSDDLLRFEPADANARPFDATADIGFRFDTPVGIFALSLNNLLELVPIP